MPDLLITFTASVLIWFMYLGLAILWIIDGRVKREIVIHAFIAALVAWMASLMFKDVFNTTRPYIQDGLKSLVLWMPQFENGAFPSSHAASSFALAVTIWFHDRKIGILYVAASLLIGLARVLARVHYPIDILGGAVLGILMAFLVEKIHFKFRT